MAGERDKNFFVRISVAVLAILILALWVFNLQNVWRQEKKMSGPDDSQEWASLKNDLDKTLAGLKDKLSQFDKANKDNVKNQEFLNNLVNETKRLASSTSASSATEGSVGSPIATQPEATTTPSSTAQFAPKGQNCPAYIDCMPTIGAARPCQIPAGCEGITQIAY